MPMDDLNLRFKLLWGLLGTLARWHGALHLTLTPTLLSNLVPLISRSYLQPLSHGSLNKHQPHKHLKKRF